MFSTSDKETLVCMTKCDPCVFPFNNNGKTYNGCTDEGNDDVWCAIKTNPDQGYVVEDWGFCKEDCPLGKIS